MTEQNKSRSVQRRIASQKGQPPPDFSQDKYQLTAGEIASKCEDWAEEYEDVEMSDAEWEVKLHSLIANAATAKVIGLMEVEHKAEMEMLRQAVAVEYKKSTEEAHRRPFDAAHLNKEHRILWRGHASAYSEVLSHIDQSLKSRYGGK